jgi:hypothetical protein
MNPERFEQDLLRYGAEPDNWPWLRRAGLRRLLRRLPEARARLERTRALERALEVEPEPLPPGLQQRLDAIPRQFPQQVFADRDAPAPDRRLLRIGLGWALACGVAGIVIGASGWWPAPVEYDAAVAFAADLAVGSPDAWHAPDLGGGP